MTHFQRLCDRRQASCTSGTCHDLKHRGAAYRHSSAPASALRHLRGSKAASAKTPAPGAGQIIAVPDGATALQVQQAKNALTTGRGKVSLIETTAAGWGQGQQAKPSGDYQQRRFGPEPPATAIDLREKSAAALIAALGAPTPSAQGAALREGYRHFMANTVASIAKLIAQEMSLKLERTVTIRFPERIRSDISALSRAYKSLSETDRQWAAGVVGLPSPPEEVIIPPDAPDDTPAANRNTKWDTRTPKRRAKCLNPPGYRKKLTD